MPFFAAMTPQRRTALISVLAACLLIALKLGTGLATHSLGLLSESVHSGTDLVAALLTFVALGVAVRPADPGHAYGHGKAEHLAALAEAAILVVASLWIGWRAILRLTDHAPGQVDPKWYAFVIVGAVMVIDASRALVSYRAGRRPGARRCRRTRSTSRAISPARPRSCSGSRPRPPATTGPTRSPRCSWPRSSCWLRAG